MLDAFAGPNNGVGSVTKFEPSNDAIIQEVDIEPSVESLVEEAQDPPNNGEPSRHETGGRDLLDAPGNSVESETDELAPNTEFDDEAGGQGDNREDVENDNEDAEGRADDNEEDGGNDEEEGDDDDGDGDGEDDDDDGHRRPKSSRIKAKVAQGAVSLKGMAGGSHASNKPRRGRKKGSSTSSRKRSNSESAPGPRSKRPRKASSPIHCTVSHNNRWEHMPLGSYMGKQGKDVPPSLETIRTDAAYKSNRFKINAPAQRVTDPNKFDVVLKNRVTLQCPTYQVYDDVSEEAQSDPNRQNPFIYRQTKRFEFSIDPKSEDYDAVLSSVRKALLYEEILFKEDPCHAMWSLDHDDRVYGDAGHYRVIYERSAWDPVLIRNLFSKHNLLVIRPKTGPLHPFDHSYTQILESLLDRDAYAPLQVHSELYNLLALSRLLTYLYSRS